MQLTHIIDFNEKNNEKDRRFKVDLNMRISKYKIIFAKGSL